MILKQKDEKFNPKFEVVSCYIEYNGKILLLKRQINKTEANTYGVPAGKVEKDEDIYDAIIREVKEETGISLEKEKLKYYKIKYVRYTDYDFIYHIFHYKLDKEVNVKINELEHQEYLWETPINSLKLDLIEDEDECIKDYYNLK